MQDFALAPQTDLSAINATMLDALSPTDQRDLLQLVDAEQAIRAQSDFTVYCKRVIPGFIASPFHVELCELLMAAERGDMRRLLIEAPVRFGKTKIASETFGAWAMGRRSIPMMLCSYGGNLAHRSSRRLRNLILSPAHLSVFPEARLSSDATSAEAFELVNGSAMTAAGTNGPILGAGWKIGILDDLLKGREAADSPVQRDGVWEWFLSDFMSREEFPSALVFITARWSDDDPAGRIRELVKDEVEDWTIRSFAALDENDESLCEELRPAEELKRIRVGTPVPILAKPVHERSGGRVRRRVSPRVVCRERSEMDSAGWSRRLGEILRGFRYRHDVRCRRFHGAYCRRGRCRRHAACRRCLARTGEPGRVGGRAVAARVPLASAEMGLWSGRVVPRGGAVDPKDDAGNGNLCTDRDVPGNPRPGCALASVRRANGKRPHALGSVCRLVSAGRSRIAQISSREDG